MTGIDPAFSNRPVAPRPLPSLDDGAFNRCDPRYQTMSLLLLAGSAVFVALVLGVIAARSDSTAPILAIAAGLVALAAIIAVLRVIELRHLGWQTREHDVSVRGGMLWKRVETIPYARVQHVRINRSALERPFGLATLSVHSAGPDLRIPGLDAAQAEQLRLFVIERAGALAPES